MFKKILASTILIAFVCSFQLSPNVKTINDISHTVGGYHVVNQKLLASDPTFVSAESLARQTYKQQYNGELGNLIMVEEQIVAGVNYKMVFESSEGPIQIIVFEQPWTHTEQVTQITPLGKK